MVHHGVDAGAPTRSVGLVPPLAPDRPPTWSGTALVVRGTDVLERTSLGPAAAPDGPACSPATRFQAGSVSKLVVAVVVLRLVEQGLLRLDEPVGHRFAGAPRTWEGMTVAQLLGHTSGLGHWGDVPGLGASFASAPPSREDLLAMVVEAPLVSPPGRAWHYSGPGFLVAAGVVEAATGASYGAVVDDLVLRPAGLLATTSGRHPTPETDADVALGHRDGEVVVPHPGLTHLPGTGDLWTTAGDLVALNRALRRGVVVAPASAARLWTPQTSVGSGAGGGPVVVDAYGFGTFLGRVRGRPARINPGDNPGYQSLLAHLPEDDLDVVVLANAEAPAVDAALTGLISLGGLGGPATRGA